MHNKLQHIYWFAPYTLKGPSTRYRGYYPTQVLGSKYGIECNFVYPSRGISKILHFGRTYLRALFSRRQNSVIVIQKVCSNRIYAKLLKILVSIKAKNSIYDIDDAEYLRQDTKTLHFFLRKCNTISVGSFALKDYCRDYNKNVVILTSPVINHTKQKSRRNEVPNIGWVGDLGQGYINSIDFSHKKSMFNILFPNLKQLNRPIILTLIGVKNEKDIPLIIEYFQENLNIEINIPRNLDWENDEWVYSEIEKFDIGVSPLTNHLFNVSKSAFKAKQYLSVGIPTVASDIGENGRFVKHNINGYLCKCDDEFKTAIENIMDMNNQEYFRLSGNAIRTRRDYSIERYCELLIEICENALQYKE